MLEPSRDLQEMPIESRGELDSSHDLPIAVVSSPPTTDFTLRRFDLTDRFISLAMGDPLLRALGVTVESVALLVLLLVAPSSS